MKKKYTLLLLFLTLGVMAQTDCQIKLESAKEIMESDALFKDYDKIFQELLPCAESGVPLAQNYIGLMYIEGLGVVKDEAKGFGYIEQAAIGDNPVAQNNLGNLYRQGQGCAINMGKAVEWYQKAADKKNSRAAYSLGYMYLKGFGVPQDYAQAVAWFEKSKFDMAKHWLGVCYYLGYGVQQNTEKALEYLYGNKTLNSKAFLKNIKIDKREQVLTQADQAIEKANEGDKKIAPEVITASRELATESAGETISLKAKDILGQWTGRFIEYDWSGTIPLRVLPIDITFSKNELGDLQTKIIFEGKTFEDVVLFENNNLFLQGFNFNLDQLYSHSFKVYPLDYTVLGMDMTQRKYNNTRYLLADVDSFIGVWKEPGTPISLVLRPKNDKTVTAEEDAVLLALASQKAEFIKVYPVPFKEQLYIGFELNDPAQVQITLTSVATAHTVRVAVTKLEAGMQSYTVDTASLPEGYYVVRVQENEKVHTRVVIKQ
ncbi:T9SS type A sorting domain-containing protein [Flavobacterium marginilacus]|uniref:T9SS type A sorting domain-containing protein n=1 Tax=Flavobacterium marginilacus TaxID=3003256 RepID=UPI00248F35D6|nr:T9SS type A sorting domain-containing protein [Flavobacterium marginilacus]